jgi:putative transposase
VNVYPFIEAEKSKRRNVTRACVLLHVSRSAFYADRTGGPSQRARDDAELTDAIVAVYDESDGTYGAPRVHAELIDQGRRHSRKRIARLMRAAGRRGRAPKRWRTTTVPDPTADLPTDLIGRDFATATAAVNARWCGDITYIHTWEGWLYLLVTSSTSPRGGSWAGPPPTISAPISSTRPSPTR